MNSLFFPVTENCNLTCRHCYLSAGPGKKDTIVSQGDFEKMIGNLPVGDVNVKLSGGEVFTQRKELYSFLDFLQDKKKIWRGFSRVKYGVSSNGYWGKSLESAEEVLLDLEERGVEDLRILSHDQYHRECGIKKEYFKNIKEASGVLLGGRLETRIPSKFLIREEHEQFPIGRAKDFGVENEELTINFPMSCIGSFGTGDGYSLTADSKGNLYTCCFQAFKLDGNLIEEPLDDIIERSALDKDLMTLVKYGPGVLASMKGLDDDVIGNIVKNQGNCGLCYRAFVDEHEGIEGLSELKC